MRGSLTGLLACCIGAVLVTGPALARDEAETPVEYRFEILGYKQDHVLDPARGEFRSSQDVRIRNATDAATTSIVFNSHPNLDIVNITVTDASGAKTAVAPGETVVFHIDYELVPDGALDAPRDMYEFTVSPQASYSVYIGCNPLFGTTSGAPYEMTVRYPRDYALCVPGELVTSTSVDGDRVDTYRSAASYQPSFACARYRKIVKTNEQVTLEYYLYPQEEFSDEMARITFEILSLYTSRFGSRGANVYRYATVGPLNAPYPGGENKGGANFVSAWAAEQLVGAQAGAKIRRQYSEGVVRSRASEGEGTAPAKRE